jgi:hypothetical protein
MMGSKQRDFAPLIHVSLEDLVPQDHFYRHLERTLDLSFVRTFAQDTYASGGRPHRRELRRVVGKRKKKTGDRVQK